MKHNINKIFVLIICVGSLLLCGCQLMPISKNIVVGPDVNVNMPTDDLIVVGVSQLGSESVWRTANTSSVQKALSKDAGFFAIMNNARQKQENQIKAIRSFISQRVDYIVVAPLLEEGWENTLKEAQDAGIPVILMDRQVSADSSLYTTSVGTDKWAEGEKAAHCLENELKINHKYYKDINIVVLQGTQGSSAQLGRTMGFNSIAMEHENWHILAEEDAAFTTTKGKEVMEGFLNDFEDIDVVISQNDDMTFGAIEAINEAGLSTGRNADIILISYDACHNALELVKDGIINADIECNPEQGDLIADIIKKLENGEEVDKQYMVEELVFTPENVMDYINSRSY